jgi:hypothetical protein
MTSRLLSCLSTDEVVAPATESCVALTVPPVCDASPLAVRFGYGLQAQLVPRGTESPRATTDDICKSLRPALVLENFEMVGADAKQPATRHVRATNATAAQRDRASLIPSGYSRSLRALGDRVLGHAHMTSRHARPRNRSVACFALAGVLDYADEFFEPVAVLSRKRDEFSCFGDNGASVWCACDGDAAAAAEFQQPFVA